MTKPSNEEKLNAAKAWLKGETVLREESHYCLDHPVKRDFHPAAITPEQFNRFLTAERRHQW